MNLVQRPVRTLLLASAIALPIGIGIYSVSFAAPLATPVDVWKNRPAETFRDGAANFQRAKELLLAGHFDAKLTEDELYRAATDGMLRSLNPGGIASASDTETWNKLLSPTERAELEGDLSGKVTGIGVQIKFTSETGLSSVIGLVPKSSAERAGVRVGDQILSVNGKFYRGLEFRDVVYAIRGPVGEKVRLKILRGDQIVEKTLKREGLTWSPVEARTLEHGIGVIRIRYFNETTPELLRAAIGKVSASRALVIDLRDNSGGLFDQAVTSAGLLVPRGSVIVRTKLRGGREESIPSKADPIAPKVPLVVLVDGETSSGAELFAASLVELLGARLVGTHTHGKWSAQMLEALPNGYAIKFTTKQFRSPSGKSFAGTGMIPDVLVGSSDRNGGTPDAPEGDDPALRAGLAILGNPIGK